MSNEYINYLLMKLYNLNISEFRAMYDLKEGFDCQQLGEFFDNQNSIFLGISKNVNDNLVDLDNLAVVGGPCICYCRADINKIALQEIVDIIYPMYFAKKLNKPCVIYLQIHEAFLQQIAITGVEMPYSEWEKIHFSLERIIMSLGNKMGLTKEELFIISTDFPNIKKELDMRCDKLREKNMLMPDRLDGLYSINNKSDHPKNSPLKDIFYKVYERNLMVYIPEFIGTVVGWNVENILVVENSTQLKAICTAKTINDQYMNEQKGIYIASFLSTPGVLGYEMSQSFSKDKIFLNENDFNVSNLYKRASEEVAWYYKYCVPKELLGYEEADFDDLLAFLRDIFRILI